MMLIKELDGKTLARRVLLLSVGTMFAALLTTFGSVNHARAADDAKFMRDLAVEQRPMAQLPMPNAEQTGGIKVNAWVNQKDKKYRVGDTLTLFVKTNTDAYVTVLDTGTSGQVSVIYPNKFQKKNLIKAGQSVTIPAKGAGFVYKVSAPAGPELITVIATKKSLPVINEAVVFTKDAAPFKSLKKPASGVVKDLQVLLKKNHTVAQSSSSSASPRAAGGWSMSRVKVYVVK